MKKVFEIFANEENPSLKVLTENFFQYIDFHFWGIIVQLIAKMLFISVFFPFLAYYT